MKQPELYPCPYDKAVRCYLQEPCKGCETWAKYMALQSGKDELTQAEGDNLLNPDDFTSIDIDAVRKKWNSIFNVPNNGWEQIERDLNVIKNKSLPLTLRTYLINKMAYCVIYWTKL